MLTRAEIAELASRDYAVAVSIFLPTHRKGRETRADPIRLRNLLAEAEHRLLEAGQRRPDIDALLAPASVLLDDRSFWEHQMEGLAIFLAPGESRILRLPLPLEEAVEIASRFRVRPLLPLIGADGLFHVLAVSAGRARLFEASRFTMAEVPLDAMPDSVSEVFRESNYQNMLHAAPPARPRTNSPVGMAKAHAFGETPEELRKAQLLEYLRRIGVAVGEFCASRPGPVVLVADAQNQGNFRAHAKLKNLLPQGIETNPDALDEDELHQRALAVVEPYFASSRQEALSRLHALAGSGDGRAALRPEDILTAARDGRVDTLFLAADGTLRGHIAELDERTLVNAAGTTGDEDVVDAAAARTLAQSGQIFVVEREALPRAAAMAALLRY